MPVERWCLLLACCAAPMACCVAASVAAPPLRIEGVLVTPALEVEAPARAEGPLVEVRAKEGQVFKIGETLAQVDSRPLALAVDAANNELAKARHAAENDLQIRLAEKKLALAEQEFQRVSSKVALVGGAISESEVQRKELAREEAMLQLEHAKRLSQQARLEVAAQETKLQEAKLRVEQCRVPCIFDGKVTQVLKHRGEWVRPGDPVARLIRTDRMRVEGFLGVAEATDSLESRPARLTVTIDGQAMQFAGRVTFVHSDVTAHKDLVRVRAEVANRGGLLRPGMKGVLEISLPDRAAAANSR